MTKCTKIEIKEREVCIGDLKHLIEIIPHTIVVPMLNDPEYTIDKTPAITTTWAAIQTSPNKAIFDGANQEQTVSHDFYIRFNPNVTSEHWIRFKGDFYNIITTENLEEQDTYLRLRANIRGKEI